MNVDQNDELDDAEFEAFMAGKGNLADLLQAMPQATPSPELDAAILAHVETSLAATEQPTVNDAANDSAVFTPPTHRPSFLSRWKVPLGLVASVVLTFSLLSPQWQKPTTQQPAESRLVPIAPSPAPTPAAIAAAPPVDSMRQQTSSGAITQDKDSPKVAKADLDAPSRIAQADEVARKKSLSGFIKSENATIALKKTEALAEKENDNPPHPPASLAMNDVQPPAAPKPAAAEPAAQSETQDVLASKPALADASPAPSLEMEKSIAPRALQARSLARAKTAYADNTSDATPPPQSYASNTNDMVTSKQIRLGMSAPIPAPAPAPIVAAAPAPYANSIVGASKQSSEQRDVAPTTPDELPLKADVWLQKIEKLMKAGSNKEALTEWNKFRITYPDYSVKKSVLRQIESIKKDATATTKE